MSHSVLTVGELAHRMGMAMKVLRRQQDMGLVCTSGRGSTGSSVRRARLVLRAHGPHAAWAGADRS